MYASGDHYRLGFVLGVVGFVVSKEGVDLRNCSGSKMDERRIGEGVSFLVVADVLFFMVA